MITKTNILIVGGTGFLGTNLALKLTKNKKYKVDLLVKNKKKINKALKSTNYFNCDISNFKDLKKKIQKSYHFVINLSGNINHKKNTETKQVHFNGLKNLVSVIDKKNLKLFIQTGSSLEYGRMMSPQKEKIICKPVSFYGEAKYRASQYIIKNLKNYLIIRPYQIYGPYQKKNRLIPMMINSCLKNEKFNCTNGSQLRDFLYVDDFSNLLIKILKKRNFKHKIYNVGYGKPFEVKYVINSITKIIKRGEPLFGKIKMREDEIKKLYPNISRIKKDLKWRPTVNLTKGLKKTITFYKTLKKKGK